MTEESETFKITSSAIPGSENHIVDSTGNKSSACVVTTVASMGPEPIWTNPAPPPPPPVEDYNNYYYNSPLNFPQNGYYFQNFGPPPNMGKLQTACTHIVLPMLNRLNCPSLLD